MSNTTRKNSPPIKVYRLPEERKLIAENAHAAGYSTTRYLREVGQGYTIKGVMDYERVLELVKINGDLGRLGGLLKLWLSNDERAAHFGYATIHSVLAKIEKTQDEMRTIMREVVMPGREK